MADGRIEFTPPVDQRLNVTFAYTVKDNDDNVSNSALVSVKIYASYQNQLNALDVDADGSITPLDVLTLVNDINRNGLRDLPNGTPSTAPYLDVNGNALLDAGDPLIAAPVAVAMGDMIKLLLSTDVPAVASLRGTSDTLQLVATSRFDVGSADSVTNVLEIRGAGVVVALDKSVDRLDATVGDILTYTVRFTATGGGTATNFRLVDLIPTGTTYVPGTLRLDGVPLSDSPDGDAGSYSAATSQVRLVLPSVASGQTGAFAFQVRVVSP